MSHRAHELAIHIDASEHVGLHPSVERVTEKSVGRRAAWAGQSRIRCGSDSAVTTLDSGNGAPEFRSTSDPDESRENGIEAQAPVALAVSLRCLWADNALVCPLQLLCS